MHAQHQEKNSIFPMVSIITATKDLIAGKRVEFFQKCIDSVQSQDYPHFEHIIIDAASTDGTLDLIKEYTQNNNVRYISEPDSGIYNAYNKGIQMAKGKYIAFLNTDDYYTRNNAFSSIIQKMEENDADFTYGDVDIIFEDGRFKHRQHSKWQKCFARIPFNHGSMFAKKNLFEKLGYFDESYRISADFNLIYRSILASYKAVEILESFVVYRLGGVSTTQDVLIKKENARVIQENCHISAQKAMEIYESGHVPFALLEQLLKKAQNIPSVQAVKKYNRIRFFKFLKNHLLYVLGLKNNK